MRLAHLHLNWSNTEHFPTLKILRRFCTVFLNYAFISISAPQTALFHAQPIKMHICYNGSSYNFNVTLDERSRMDLQSIPKIFSNDLKLCYQHTFISQVGGTIFWSAFKYFCNICYTHPWSVMACATVKKAEMTAPCAKALSSKQARKSEWKRRIGPFGIEEYNVSTSSHVSSISCGVLLVRNLRNHALFFLFF